MIVRLLLEEGWLSVHPPYLYVPHKVKNAVLDAHIKEAEALICKFLFIKTRRGFSSLPLL